MIFREVFAGTAGRGIRVVGGKVCRGVGVPGVQARFLYVWGRRCQRRMRALGGRALVRSEQDG